MLTFMRRLLYHVLNETQTTPLATPSDFQLQLMNTIMKLLHQESIILQHLKKNLSAVFV